MAGSPLKGEAATHAPCFAQSKMGHMGGSCLWVARTAKQKRDPPIAMLPLLDPFLGIIPLIS